MHRYLDYHLKTKFDVPEGTIVFFTNKTLNERFTGHSTRRVFILNNGYTALYENNIFRERVAFQNRRRVDFHKRFSLYQRGDVKVIEKKVFGNEDKNRLKLKLDEIGHRRRTVLKRRQLSDDCKNSFNLHGNPVKRTWYGQPKGKDVTTDDRLKDSEGSEPIVYSPYPSSMSNYISKSSYKWKRRPPTKEELDAELDSYMAEAKFKTAPTTPIKEDVDSFVKEYMLETEKCLNENADIILE